MHPWFTLKVSDLLLHAWSQDTISFASIFSTKLPTNEKWINITILIEHLNKNELLVTLEEWIAYFHTPCDRCWKIFEEQRVIRDCVWKATVWTLIEFEDSILIDEKNLTLDLENFIVDQFNLHEPIKKLCTKCQKILQDDDNEIESISWTIKRE